MIRPANRKILGLIRFLKVVVPAIRQVTGRHERWQALQESGIVIVGMHTYGLPDVLFWDYRTRLEIGKFCSIAQGAVFILGGNHRTDWVSTFPFNAFPEKWPQAKSIEGEISTNGDIIVGNDVWIGHGAIILSGVKIGNGAIIGAGSIVTKDVEDFAIVGGNPARIIRYRFNKATRSRISGTEWWNWSEERIARSVNELMDVPSD